MNEKKLSEFIENEKRLLSEIESLKNERDQKLIEYQKMLDMERETFKEKMNSIEHKYKESEHKRS